MPGDTELTRTPDRAHWPARFFERVTTPALAGPYACCGPPTAESEAMFTILPRPCRAICVPNTRFARNVPVRLTSMILRYRSIGKSAGAHLSWNIAAHTISE